MFSLILSTDQIACHMTPIEIYLTSWKTTLEKVPTDILDWLNTFRFNTNICF